MDQAEPHPLGNRREGVRHYLERDRVERHTRSTTTAPDAWAAPRHPGSMRAVASRPARIAGPSSVTPTDRKSTRLNSSHLVISYAVFCLKKKKEHTKLLRRDFTLRSTRCAQI